MFNSIPGDRNDHGRLARHGRLVIASLGLHLLGLHGVARWWPLPAGLAAVSLLLPAGWAAGLLSAPHLVATLAALVGVGFLVGRVAGQQTGDGVELLGAGVLTGALWLAVGRRLAAHRHPADALLGGVAGLTMTLALLYAGGSFLGFPHPSLDWMVAGHGVLNAGAVLSAVTLFWRDRPDRPRPMRHGRFRHRIGTGRARFEAASAALLRWDMHRGAGGSVDADTPVAAVGLRMSPGGALGRCGCTSRAR